MKSPQSQRSSHSEIDDRGKPLPGQPTEGEEWDLYTKKEWDLYTDAHTDADRRTPSDIVSIFRVPTTLKEQKKEAYYVPKIVSLGPYHHRSEKLAPMGRHKGTALRRMMTRSNTRRGNHLNILEFSDSAKEEIAKLEKIKDSYEEDICCAGETLAMMLTLDGCFILEILRTMIGDELEEASKYYDPIFGTKKIEYTGNDILCDILKLENQIPLIVLQHLQQLDLKLKSSDFLAFLEVALLRIFNPFRYDRTKWCNRQPHEPVHLLDLLHGLIVSPPCHHNHEDQIELDIFCSCCNRKCRTGCKIGHQERGKPVETGENRSIRQATELRNAGINFRTCSGGIRQIKFESKAICLPPITIEDDTEVLFRNLIAFEMCKPSKTNYVAFYVKLMDDLIDSNEDVALLRRMGIVTNNLGSDTEVAELFNGLGKGVFLSNNKRAFDQLAQRLNIHYNNKTTVQIATLVEEHFYSAWKFLSLSGATVLLLLAIVQTIYTIISVYKK